MKSHEEASAMIGSTWWLDQAADMGHRRAGAFRPVLEIEQVGCGDGKSVKDTIKSLGLA